MNEGNGLACQMHLLLGDDGVGIQARQTGARCEGQTALAGVEDVLALLAELADLRSGAPLVPRHDAQPFPARALHGVCQGWQLPPVREHHQGRSGTRHAPALHQPERTPHGPAALILGVAQHGRVVLLAAA